MKAAVLVVVLFSAAGALADTGNLIQNGSFEGPVALTGWTLSHDYLYPFWKRQWDGGGENLFPSDYSYYQGTNHIWMAFNAEDGSKAVNVHSASLYQIVNTVPGQSYRLHFYVGSFDDGRSPPSDYNHLGSLDLAVLGGENLAQTLAQFFAGYQTIPGGVSVDWVRFDNDQPGLHAVNWLPFEYPFIASASQAVFIFQGGGYSFSTYTGLDDVSLTLVPEPSVSRLSLLGLVLLSFVLRRPKCPEIMRPQAA
jgi:hypothetical protein